MIPLNEEHLQLLLKFYVTCISQLGQKNQGGSWDKKGFPYNLNLLHCMNFCGMIQCMYLKNHCA